MSVDGRRVLHGIDLELDDGEVLAVVGPTGGGKTTLLRAIAGLARVERGDVLFDGVSVTGLAARERNVAVVFQRAALDPHRDVAGNLAFPLELRRGDVTDLDERVGAEARAFHIETLLARRADRLTPGETQLVQIARALVKQPSVLLLDEPFAHLDDPTRVAVRREIALIQQGLGITTVLVVARPEDAAGCADRVAVLAAGRIVQIGSPVDVHDHPASVAIAQLTGAVDVIPVTVGVDELGAWLEHPGFRLRAWQPRLRSMAGSELLLVVRPTWWRADPNGPIEVAVDRSVPLGPTTVVTGHAHGHALTLTLPFAAAHPSVRLALDRYLLADARSGAVVDLSVE